MLKPTHVHTSLALVSSGILIDHLISPQNAAIVNPAFDLPLLFGTAFGATIPDIDHSSTKINRVFGNFGKAFAKIIGHRTWTHTLWAIILWFVIAYTVGFYPHFLNLYTPTMVTQSPICAFVWGIAIGNLLHILEDNCSMQGVLFLYPFTSFATSKNGHPYKQRKWSNARYKTGSGAENAINLLMIALFTFDLYQFWPLWFH